MHKSTEIASISRSNMEQNYEIQQLLAKISDLELKDAQRYQAHLKQLMDPAERKRKQTAVFESQEEKRDELSFQETVGSYKNGQKYLTFQ